MVDLVECLTNLLFFGIQLFYYYAGFSLLIIYYLSSGICILIHTYVLGTNLNSSMICFLSSGDMYLFLGVTISTSSSFVWSLSCNSLECFFRKSCYFISNFITNQITCCFCCLLNCSFRCCFYCICCRCFSTIKKVLMVFIT